MSIVVTRSVFCDATNENGRACTNWTAQTTELATGARRMARMDGWRRRGGKDLCPKHADNPGSDR